MPPVDVKGVRRQADMLESALMGHLFFGGSKPSQEDVDTFNAMFGAENRGLHRWVRHMASFTAVEREEWGGAVPL